MDILNIKCKNHENLIAFKYCHECNIYICHKCFNHHSKQFQNLHHLSELSGDISQFFTGLCKEDNHSNKLEYYCETHNKLVCKLCIGKEQNISNCKHKECKISQLNDIKENKKNNFEKNMKMLEDLSNIIKDKIKKLSDVYKKLNDNKEDLKSKIQKTITNIRNKINEREDELFSTLDSIFSDICPSEKIMKDFEKMPKKIEDLLQKKNDIEKKLDDSFILNSYINDCINIENDLNNFQEKINMINKYNQNSELKFKFYPDENELIKLYDIIKSFGKIYNDENDKKYFYIYEEEKEIKELKEKIKELEKETEKIKNENDSECKKLKRNINEIENELNEEKDENRELRNKLENSKIRFTIRSKLALNKCLDTRDLGYGRTPHLWDYGHNNQNQIFELIKNWDGSYLIKNSRSGLYLGFDSDKICMRHRNENSQNFYLHHYGDGYYLFQEKNGATIDLYGSKTDNDAYIGRYSRHNQDNQQWKLVVHL